MPCVRASIRSECDDLLVAIRYLYDTDIESTMGYNRRARRAKWKEVRTRGTGKQPNPNGRAAPRPPRGTLRFRGTRSFTTLSRGDRVHRMCSTLSVTGHQPVGAAAGAFDGSDLRAIKCVRQHNASLPSAASSARKSSKLLPRSSVLQSMHRKHAL